MGPIFLLFLFYWDPDKVDIHSRITWRFICNRKECVHLEHAQDAHIFFPTSLSIFVVYFCLVSLHFVFLWPDILSLSWTFGFETYINQKGAGVAKLARAPGAPNTKVLGWKCCKYLFQDFSLKLIHFVYFLILNSIASQIWNNVFWKILKNKTLKQFILINVSFLNI